MTTTSATRAADDYYIGHESGADGRIRNIRKRKFTRSEIHSRHVMYGTSRRLNKGSKMTYNVKYMLVGDSGVGKSSILLNFTEKRFTPEGGCQTIGVDYGLRSMIVNNQKVRIQVCDTTGNKRFRPIVHEHLTKVAVIMVVYDITDRHTFDTVQHYWLPYISRHNFPLEQRVVVVGNKTDQYIDRQVNTDEGHELASRWGLPYYEVSAAILDNNIDNLFFTPAQGIMDSIRMNQITPRDLKTMGIFQDISRSYVTQKIEHGRDCCWFF
jgi:small GTP-binding protein